MFDLGGGELLLILLGVLVLFGPKKLPELAQGLGKGLRQFRKAQQDFTDQVNTALYEEERKDRTRSGPKQATHTVARSSEQNRIAPPQQDRSLEEPRGDTQAAERETTAHADAEAERQSPEDSAADPSRARGDNVNDGGDRPKSGDSETERSND